MSATLLYRIAAGVLVLFAAGHTFGFLRFKPPTREGAAVRASMDEVSFPVGGRNYTYGGFYRGFGLSISAYLLFTAYLAWHLGALTVKAPSAIGGLGWVFCALQLANAILGWLYFAPVTVVFSAVVVICTAWAAWLVP
jgi:hypothetical protein